MTDFSIYEILGTLILIAPLAATIMVLTGIFVGAGIRDLSNQWKMSEPEPVTPQLAEPDHESEIDTSKI